MPNTEQKPLIMTLIDERVIRCPNCHSILHWTGRNTQCQECYTIFKCKNGAIDLYGRYKEQCLDNVVVSNFYSYVDSSYDRNLFCFIACDALNTPFATASFDGCVIFAALHHFPDPVNLLLYLKKLVKRDGFFAIMREPCNPNLFDPDYLRDLRSSINEQMWSIEDYSHIFDEARLKLHTGRIDSKCSLKVILVPDDYKKGVFGYEEKNRYLL